MSEEIKKTIGTFLADVGKAVQLTVDRNGAFIPASGCRVEFMMLDKDMVKLLMVCNGLLRLVRDNNLSIFFTELNGQPSSDPVSEDELKAFIEALFRDAMLIGKILYFPRPQG